MRAADIKRLTELRASLADSLRQVQESGRPLFITNNGRTAGVLLSPEAYDELLERLELAECVERVRRIQESAAQHDAGQGIEARGATLDLAKRHGIDLESEAGYA